MQQNRLFPDRNNPANVKKPAAGYKCIAETILINLLNFKTMENNANNQNQSSSGANNVLGNASSYLKNIDFNKFTD